MKNIWILWVGLVIGYPTLAQTSNKTDSLLNLLKNKKLSNIQKIDIYNLLSEQYAYKDSIKVEMYLSKALNLGKQHQYFKGQVRTYCLMGWTDIDSRRLSDAEKNFRKSLDLSLKHKHKKGEANAYAGMGALAIHQKKTDELHKYYEKALSIYKSLKATKLIMMIYRNWGFYYEYINDYEKVIGYYKQYLKISKEAKKLKAMAYINGRLGYAYHKLSDFKEALKYHSDALKIQIGLKDSTGITGSYNDMGILYESMGDYKGSLQSYLKALKILEQTKSKQLGTTLNNIGVLFYEQKSYDKALLYYKRYLELSLKNKDEFSLPTAYNNIALIYEHTDKLQQAEENYEKCIKLAKKLQMQDLLGWAYNGMAIIRYKSKKLDEAEVWAKKGLKERQEVKEQEHLAQSYNTLGKVYLLKQQHDKALDNYQKAADICKKIGYPLNYKDALEGLSNCYEAIGETAKALSYHKQFHQLSDSLINTKSTIKIAYLEAEFDFNKEKDSLQVAQEKERQVFAEETKQRKMTQRATFVGLSMALILVVILLLFYFSKQKSNRVLTKLNQQLSEANERIVAETNARVDAEKDKVRSELNLKNQQLASQTLHMLQKNQILNELKGMVSDVRKEKDYKKATKKFSQLANLIDYGINLDKDWEGFQKIFEQLHPDFYANLKGQFPGLTPNDLHLCALLKLNLSTREIADLLGIAQESLKVKRYRLRQKMGLESDRNLNEFIITFDAA
ncbi:MAG TPA: hypothetical protein DCS93_33930 [Microscillaceae bacterium]|nr:hypothetical protein [Microscillaceae bacterium]